MCAYKLFNTLFVGVVLVVTVFVYILNVFVDMSIPTSVVKLDADLGWSFCGSRSQKEIGLGEFTLRFNSKGLRGDEGELNQQPIKMLLLGNSVTMGQHVPEQNTFAYLIGSLNGGADGYDTYQQVTRFFRDLRQLNPQKIGLVVVATDVISKNKSQERIQQTLNNNHDLKKMTKLDFNRVKEGFRPKIERFSDIDSTEKDRYYLQYVNQPKDESIWEEWTQSILTLKNNANDFFIIVSPPRSQVKAYQDGVRNFEFNNNIEAFCQVNNIKLINLLPVLAEYDVKAVYFDFVHFNELGHKIVAEEIIKQMNSK